MHPLASFFWKKSLSPKSEKMTQRTQFAIAKKRTMPLVPFAKKCPFYETLIRTIVCAKFVEDLLSLVHFWQVIPTIFGNNEARFQKHKFYFCYRTDPINWGNCELRHGHCKRNLFPHNKPLFQLFLLKTSIKNYDYEHKDRWTVILNKKKRFCSKQRNNLDDNKARFFTKKWAHFDHWLWSNQLKQIFFLKTLIPMTMFLILWKKIKVNNQFAAFPQNVCWWHSTANDD